jgi:bacterioferritin
MQGKTKVIKELNHLLTGELSSADQYFTHSEMYKNWGYHQLFERMDHERLEELEHAQKLIARILFLGGTPDVGSRAALTIGKDVPEMLKNDLESEIHVGNNLKKVVALCETEQDFETRRILVELLHATEEDHTLWLEQQLNLIKNMGLQNYLQSVAQPVAKK